MSWFKDKVEDWDMVGKALERSMPTVVVTEVEGEVEEEVVVPLAKGLDQNEKLLRKLKAEAKAILSGA